MARRHGRVVADFMTVRKQKETNRKRPGQDITPKVVLCDLLPPTGHTLLKFPQSSKIELPAGDQGYTHEPLRDILY
jgi:hypothetical protein